MPQVVIKLDFDREDVTKEDVIEYLNELIEDDSLSAIVVDNEGEYVKDI